MNILLEFVTEKPQCPNCKLNNVSKYLTYEERHFYQESRRRKNTWVWGPKIGEQRRTPENDYCKCEDCGLTWRTRK